MLASSSRFVNIAKSTPVTFSGSLMLMDCCRDDGLDIQRVELLASQAPSTVECVAKLLNRPGTKSGRKCTFTVTDSLEITIDGFNGSFVVAETASGRVLAQGSGSDSAVQIIRGYIE